METEFEILEKIHTDLLDVMFRLSQLPRSKYVAMTFDTIDEAKFWNIRARENARHQRNILVLIPRGQ